MTVPAPRAPVTVRRCVRVVVREELSFFLTPRPCARCDGEFLPPQDRPQAGLCEPCLLFLSSGIPPRPPAERPAPLPARVPAR